MVRTAALALVGLISVGIASTFAADREADAAARTGAADTGSTSLAGDTDWSLPPVQVGTSSRPAALLALYVSYAALQGFDAYTTLHEAQFGAREANPLMSGVAGNSAAMWAVKGGVTVASIYLAERLWHQHRRGQAIALMVASNGVMAAVAAHNLSVMRAQP